MELSKDLDEREKQVDDFLWNTEKKNEDVIKFYDTWHETYDKDMLTWGYHLDKPLDEFEDISRLQKDARILDVGAGTGLVGEKLAERGYKNIDALDGSEGMLKRAKEKRIYKNCFYALVTPDPIEGIPNDSYDALVCVGALDSNHIDFQCFETLVAITKPGGYIFFLTVMAYLNPKRREFFEKMRELEDKGIWDWVLLKKTQDKYDDNDLGVLFAFKVSEQKNSVENCS